MIGIGKADLLYGFLFFGKHFYAFQYTYYALSYAMMIKNLFSTSAGLSKVAKARVDSDWVYIPSVKENQEPDEFLLLDE
jgi:hypothetical protein